MADDDAVLRHELAIRRLLAEYCQLCDDGDFAGLVERFTPDGSLAFGRETMRGRDALLAFYVTAQVPELRGRHLTANVVVDLDLDGGRALAASDYVFLGFVDGGLTPIVAGRYRDELVHVDGRWMISHREASMLQAVR